MKARAKELAAESRAEKKRSEGEQAVAEAIAAMDGSGNSQAVRIPKEYQFEVGEVHINKIGSSVIVTPLGEVWSTIRDAVDEFPDDFMQGGRDQPEMQERAGIDEPSD